VVQVLILLDIDVHSSLQSNWLWVERVSVTINVTIKRVSVTVKRVSVTKCTISAGM